MWDRSRKSWQTCGIAVREAHTGREYREGVLHEQVNGLWSLLTLRPLWCRFESSQVGLFFTVDRTIFELWLGSL